MIFSSSDGIVVAPHNSKSPSTQSQGGGFMRRYLPFVVAGFVCLGIVACQTGGLSEQDQAAIRKLDDYYVQNATAEKPDWNAAVDLCYAEDAKVLPPNMPAVEGRQAIKAMAAQSPPFKEFKLDIVSLEGRGDLAYEYGTYTLAAAPPGSAAPVTDRGKYVAVWKKHADGTWKMIRDIYNSDLPAPGIVIPTGAIAADAGDELKKLGDIVGRWKMDGTMRMEPKATAEPVNITLACNWFAGGRQLVYRYSGTMGGNPFEELGQIVYDPGTKTYTFFGVVSDGSSGPGKLSIEPGTWVHTQETRMEGKPVRNRFTLANMSPAGGTWKFEASVAGAPFALLGEGKYTKAN
jgi:ketosteroid isomerase-like protein